MVRPRDLREIYRNPAKELAALARQGTLRRVAHGYYAVVPEHLRGLDQWQPSIDAVALAVAQVDYGLADAALMGMTAARRLGVVPRALGAAIVAVPARRPTLETAIGPVHFVTRRMDTLDVERTTTDLAEGWVTTVEQTLVDLLDRPDLAGFPADLVDEAARRLAARANPEDVHHVADRMHKRAATRRALELIEQSQP